MILPSHRKVGFVTAVRPSGSENGVTVAFISLHLLPVCAFNANLFGCVYSHVDREAEKEMFIETF